MRPRRLALAIVAALAFASAARADNQMGYQLLTDADARQLPQHHGALGMEIEAAQRITDSGMTFDLIRITNIRPNSPGAQAGFHPGDEIVAVDGRVFADLVAFAGYIGSIPPGQRVTIDAIPAGGGPQQAERITAIVGGPNGSTAQSANSGGLSTRAKIGLGVAALLGCYELGCFSHSQPAQPR